MMSARQLILLLTSLVITTSCFQKSTCPAFYSKYVLDENEIEKRFSLFKVDSLPKEGIGYVSKSKFGLIEEKPYWQKYREMKDVPMVTIYPEIVDSILMVREVADTLGVDSLGAPTSEPFMRNVNYDQLIYNSLFYDLLIPPEEEDITEELKEEAVQDKDADDIESEKPKKGLFRFFKKKKRKTEPEEDIFNNIPEREPVEQPVEDEDDGF